MLNPETKSRLERIKIRTLQAIEQNPVLAVAAIGALLTGSAKLMDANTKRKYQKTWKDEVERRRLNSY